MITHASVFSGIGGPEVAAAMLGWINAFHCEINPFGRAVLDYWFPNSKSYEDITKTDFTEWRGKVTVLTGGFPCQPFSYAGQRRGANDDRYLWPYMFRCIDQIQPTWVVAENVAGILTMVEQGEVSKLAGTATLFDSFDDLRGRYELRETFTLQRICTDLESHGYAVQPVLVPACAVGAPHRRDRVFIVAHRIGNASDTNNRPFQSGGNDGGGMGEEESGRTAIGCGNGGVRLGEGEWCGERWRNFPSVSPVHGRNDGLSIPPYYDAIFQTRNNMDRNSVIQGALSTGKIEVDFETGKIYSSRIRGHEGEKILLQGSECNGYIVHTLSFNGIKKQCRAHQIVWIAANGLYDKDKLQIDHINRDRKDNRLCNLRLVSAAENIANSDRPDTRMLGDEERIKIWQMYNEGHMTLREIAEDYGVSKSYIHKIVSDFPSLTIPFSKWRTEALKAYGNAIVPQVMYEIFRAIQIVSEQCNTK